MKIGLTLSGGGFRATLFHLGVLQYLRAAGLLSSVTTVTAVSGGSIIAAHMGAYWDRYNGTDEQFREAAAELIGFTQLGVREHIIAWLPLVQVFGRWLPEALRFNQSTMLSAMYSRYLFKGKTLQSLLKHDGVPQIYLAATNLSRPANLVTFSGTGVRLHGPSGYHISSTVVSLSDAVTASSAFPLLFPAVSLSTRSLSVPEGVLVPSPQFLTDGGVFDNYGLRAMHEVCDKSHPFDCLLISDAGKRAEWSPRASFSSLSLLSRSSDITSQRVSDLELEHLQSTLTAPVRVTASIHDQCPLFDNQTLDENVQRCLGTVRTDLDSFSTLLVHCLGSHGYSIAKQSWEAAGLTTASSAPSSWNPCSPHNPLSGDVPDDTRRVGLESLTRWRIFSLKEWRALTIYALCLVAAWFYLPGALVSTATSTAALIGELSRTAWTGGSLPCSTAIADNILLQSIHDGMSASDRERFQADRFLRWMNDGARPSSRSEQVLLVKTDEFSRDYRDMTVEVNSVETVLVSEGVVFLASNPYPSGQYHPTYRLVSGLYDQSGERPPELRLIRPSKGEQLVMMLKVKAKSKVAGAPLPINPDMFFVSLRVK